MTYAFFFLEGGINGMPVIILKGVRGHSADRFIIHEDIVHLILVIRDDHDIAGACAVCSCRNDDDTVIARGRVNGRMLKDCMDGMATCHIIIIVITISRVRGGQNIVRSGRLVLKYVGRLGTDGFPVHQDINDRISVIRDHGGCHAVNADLSRVIGFPCRGDLTDNRGTEGGLDGTIVEDIRERVGGH